MSSTERYIHALGLRALTPLYDPATRWLMREGTFKRQLIVQARVRAGMRVLDVGCGTGTLAIMLKQAHPAAEVVGLDGDPQVLARARAKAARAGVPITFDEGLVDRLPYPDGAFDRVLSSLVFHHLSTATKQRALQQIYRVLQPGGELHLADVGAPRNRLDSALALIVRHLERAADNLDGKLPQMFAAAGFTQVDEPARFMTLVGALALYRAVKPRSIL